MIIRTKDFKNKTALSYSKIKTFQHCSQKYYASYFLKLPDPGNDGSNRGNVTHQILEILATEKRRGLAQSLIKKGTCKKDRGLWRLIQIYARQFNVDNEDNLKQIDQFIITALNCDFLGPENTVERFIEKDFDIEFEDKKLGILFRVKGFIDWSALISQDESLFLISRDYKTSKQRFDTQEVKTSMQGAIYQMALSVLFPKIKLKEFKFIFLKFPKNPYQEFPIFSDSEMTGFQIYLSEIQKRLTVFTEKDIGSNYGKLNDKMRFLCGPAKSGWICPHQNPLDYYVLLNDKGEIIKSSFKEDLVAKEDEKVEKRYYSGCSWFFDKNGKRIRS